jgi:hypothetical protein
MKKAFIIIGILLASIIIITVITKKDTFNFTGAQNNRDPFMEMLSNRDTVVLPKIGAYVLQAIQNNELEKLQILISENGLRFSPAVRTEANNRLVGKNGITKIMIDANKYVWGTADGSGEPIEMTGAEYFEKYITSEKFFNIDPKINQAITTGNLITNISEQYPNASWIEYYTPGTEQYGEMDWNSLIMIFEYKESQWFLVGIMHGQWSI